MYGARMLGGGVVRILGMAVTHKPVSLCRAIALVAKNALTLTCQRSIANILIYTTFFDVLRTVGVFGRALASKQPQIMLLLQSRCGFFAIAPLPTST